MCLEIKGNIREALVHCGSSGPVVLLCGTKIIFIYYFDYMLILMIQCSLDILLLGATKTLKILLYICFCQLVTIYSHGSNLKCL